MVISANIKWTGRLINSRCTYDDIENRPCPVRFLYNKLCPFFGGRRWGQKGERNVVHMSSILVESSSVGVGFGVVL